MIPVVEAFITVEHGRRVVRYQAACKCGHRGSLLTDINAADREAARHIREAHAERVAA